MATQEAFKSLAKGSQSRILEQRYYDPREKELILNIENLTDVITLACESCVRPYTKLWTTLLCIAWVRSSSRIVPCHISLLHCRESLHEYFSANMARKRYFILTIANERSRLSSTS